MFRRLLVPLDGSATAEAALPYAERIARRTGAAVHLLRVIPPPPHSVFAPPPAPSEAEAQAAAEYLASVAARPMFQGLTVQTRVERGYPATVIATAARRQANTMVVMSTRGHTALRRTGLGSVADKVAHVIRTPVLLVPVLPARPLEPARVLVALDGSGRAESVLPVAVDLARALGLAVHLLHVLPPGSSPETRDRAQEYLNGVRERLDGEPVAVDVEVIEGAPAQRISEEAAERCAIIALASHGRTGLSRWFMGSVAERVIDESNCPILLVRAPIERRTAEGGVVRRRVAP